MLVLLHQYTESLGKDAKRAFLFNGACRQQNFTQFNLWILEIRDLLTCTVSVYSLWQLLKRRRRRSYVSFVLNVQSLETNWNLFFSWETHHPQTPTHKWHFFPSLGNLLCMPVYAIWTLYPFFLWCHEEGTTTSLLFIISGSFKMSLSGILSVQITPKLFFFFSFQDLRLVVIAVDVACGGGANLSLTNGLMITSEEALFPCVQEWARRSSRSEISLNR